MGHTGQKYNLELADQIAFPLPQSLNCESLPLPSWAESWQPVSQ
jgi:hypothetical protein